MTHRIRSLLVLSLVATASSLALATPAVAQEKHSITVDAPDSVSFIVPRRAPADGERSLGTRDGNATLILRDTAVVMQMTDQGMAHMFDGDTAKKGVGEAILARMVRSGVEGFMDHGIAYRLSALRRAYADGGRVVLEGRDGTHVFESTSLNGHHPMEDFTPADATRFAAAVQRAIDARR